MKNLLICAVILFGSVFFVLAQMPGWMTIHDADGNTYFVDGALKIQASGEPESDYRAVKKESAVYYLEQAKQLYRQHHKVSALILLKSIRILSDKTGSIHKAGETATAEINKIRKLEGDRFHVLDVDSSVVMYGYNGLECLASTFSGFEFCAEGRISVFKKSSVEKYNYSRDGVLAAVFPDENSENAYCLVSITSEKFHYRLKSIDNYEKTVRNKTVQDIYSRTLVKNSDSVKISEIKYSGETNFLGYEIFRIRDKTGIFSRILYPEKTDGEYSARINNIADSISR